MNDLNEMAHQAESSLNKLPEVPHVHKQIPKHENSAKELPAQNTEEKALPEEGNPENFIILNGERVEIKPTIIKYQRDRTAAFYRVLDMYPLPDILAADKNVFDADRDGDKCLFDWLIAVFNDAKLVVKHYDNMTTEDIEKILKIFKRLNNIDDKEEKAKNREAKATKH